MRVWAGARRGWVVDRTMGRMARLPDGVLVPAIGQGTWHLGDSVARRPEEAAALRAGLEAGLSLVDTAEMYGEGAAESLVGEALRGLDASERPFLVSKVYPHRADRAHIFEACAASRARLGVDRLDLYLLHWRGTAPLAETVACMGELIERGWIARWGVSNFDVDDMIDLLATPGGLDCATDQVLYNLGSRGIEYELLPWLHDRHIPVMAYCPLAQGGRLSAGILDDEVVREVAAAHDAAPAQVMLSFAVRSGWVIAIPKATSATHARENAAAMGLQLTEGELRALSKRFPAPHCKVPLDVQ